MIDTVPFDQNSEQTALLAARIRRMMLIAGLTTGLGIAAVFIAIGYRLFRSEGSVPASDFIATLPRGAKIVTSGIAGDRLIVTLDVSGTIEIRTFNARTLKPAGRLKFVSEP